MADTRLQLVINSCLKWRYLSLVMLCLDYVCVYSLLSTHDISIEFSPPLITVNYLFISCVSQQFNIISVSMQRRMKQTKSRGDKILTHGAWCGAPRARLDIHMSWWKLVVFSHLLPLSWGDQAQADTRSCLQRVRLVRVMRKVQASEPTIHHPPFLHHCTPLSRPGGKYFIHMQRKIFHAY